MENPVHFRNCAASSGKEVTQFGFVSVATRPDHLNILIESRSNNNYLLNGNKVQLYFTEMISRFFISRATEEREK